MGFWCYEIYNRINDGILLRYNKTFAVFFCWFFNKIFLLGFICFTNTNIYLGNKYHKYCWCMEPFLSIIKLFLVYDPNYSSLSLLVSTRKIGVWFNTSVRCGNLPVGDHDKVTCTLRICTTETSWWHTTETSLGISFQTCLRCREDVLVLLRRFHNVPIRRRGDTPLKHLGDVPP